MNNLFFFQQIYIHLMVDGIIKGLNYNLKEMKELRWQ